MRIAHVESKDHDYPEERSGGLARMATVVTARGGRARKCDAIEISGPARDRDRSTEWLLAYLHLLPDELVTEKVDRAFYRNASKVEILCDRILFLSF